MNRFIIPAAALALAMGSMTASAQTYQSKTTTTQSSPVDGTQTTTTTTERNDQYGSYRKTVTATKRYDAGAFAAPDGYTYTRYSLGERVPSIVLSSKNLTLSDYSNYQLDTPPEGLVWIRVGSDALLVNRSTGEVIQTDYNLFE
jgi:Ni/Co efflux regulator RcnB